MNAVTDPHLAELPRVKCLIVDDLEENIVALCALLRRDDVELLTARSGAEALELLLVNEVALAFLDVQMPDMDGFELAELIRGSERTRDVPLIFVTAGAHDQRRLFKGYETGAVDFLYKPIDPHILRNKADVFFQLHRQKQQLARELAERTETLRMNEMFMAVLGHDLRSPLGAVVMSAALLPRLSPDPEIHKAAERIASSGKRMSRMIEDVLDMARARLAGGLPLKIEAADLAEILQRVVAEQQTARPGRLIELSIAGDLKGQWDVGRLAQVAANLIGNALQHGARESTVQVRADGSHPDIIVFTVANTGNIPHEVLPHLFDPFRSGRQAAERKDGLGLGLYIVQQIVRAHHGSVHVQLGEPGRTVFRVELPRGTRQ